MRYRCDPCGFSSGVLVNGREARDLGLGERTSLSLVACPRCGRRDGGSVAWLVVSAGTIVAALSAAGALLVLEEALHWQGLGVLAIACALLAGFAAIQRFRTTRRVIAFLKY